MVAGFTNDPASPAVGSVSLQFTTYTTNGSEGCPNIAAVQNNYSYILPGLPNYRIAPGSLFIVKGSKFSNLPLTPLQSSVTPGLPFLRRIATAGDSERELTLDVRNARSELLKSSGRIVSG